MEVFGLLNLLKSALETAPPTPTESVPNESAPPAQPTQATVSPPKETPTEESAVNPYVMFAEAHDARARKIKRK